MTVTRELSTADDYAADQKQQQKLQKQQQSEAAEEPKGNPDRAMSSAAPAVTATSSAGSTSSPSTAPSIGRPKFMITDILRNDSPASVNNVHYPSPHQQQAPMPPHPFYQFNLAAAAAAAAAYGFNPAGMMPGMMPPLHQFLVGHHHHHQQQHHPQMPMMPSSGAPNSAESSPRDLSFKRSAAAANFANDPAEDEDEFVDPDGSDHDRDSPIGKVDLMLSDDESDICKFCQILCLVLGPSGWSIDRANTQSLWGQSVYLYKPPVLLRTTLAIIASNFAWRYLMFAVCCYYAIEREETFGIGCSETCTHSPAFSPSYLLLLVV